MANRVDSRIGRDNLTFAVETVRHAHAIKTYLPGAKIEYFGPPSGKEKTGNTKSQGGLSRHTYTLVQTHHDNTILHAKCFQPFTPISTEHSG